VQSPHSVTHVTVGAVSGSGQPCTTMSISVPRHTSVAQLPSGAPCAGHDTQATYQHTLIVFALTIARPGE
jgi:hypothetical protein